MGNKAPSNRIPWGKNHLGDDKRIFHQWVAGEITSGYAMWAVETVHSIPHHMFAAKDFEENANWLGWYRGAE